MSATHMFAPSARRVPLARTARALIGLLIMAIGAGCQTTDPINRESAIAENRAYNREMLAAIEARSLDGMMARIWHSPDVIFVGPGGEIGRGWDHIRSVEQEFLASFTSARLEIEDEEYAVAGDTVVSIITVKGSFTFPNGAVETARGVINGVQRKIEGKWVAIYNHYHEIETPTSPGPSEPAGTESR